MGLVAAAVAGAGPSSAAPSPPANSVFTWIVTPDEDSCHTDIELLGKSAEPSNVSLASDGQQVTLRFAKDDLPKRAFLAIDIDKKPYSNLFTRLESPKVGVMVLSDETVTAMRKGGSLLIAWLADEPVSAKLTGSEQGINDLKVCGAQVNAQYRASLAARQEAEARAAAETRAKQLAEEQVALVRAQKEAAEAQAAKLAEETRQAQAQADAQRQQALEEQQRQQAEQQRQEYLQRYYGQRQAYPPPAYYRPY
jgi:DNA segregation ATPase FtsK/SpoIIIE-like protein